MALENKQKIQSALCDRDNCELAEDQVNIMKWNGADLVSNIVSVLKLENTECFYPWDLLCVNDKCVYDEEQLIMKYEGEEGESLQDDI